MRDDPGRPSGVIKPQVPYVEHHPFGGSEAMSPLVLKRAPIGWNQDDFDVLEDGLIVGRIFTVPVAPQGRPGCGRAATRRPRSSGRRTATKRRARLRWRRSRSRGGGKERDRSRAGEDHRLQGARRSPRRSDDGRSTAPAPTPPPVSANDASHYVDDGEVASVHECDGGSLLWAEAQLEQRNHRRPRGPAEGERSKRDFKRQLGKWIGYFPLPSRPPSTHAPSLEIARDTER
jgi:hypothetical protein